MTIKVMLFAQCSDIVGSRQLEITPAPNTSVQDLVNSLIKKHPKLGAMERSIMISVNQEYVDRDQLLADGDEVAMIPPVSGGSGN
jgi:molybdopterin converting factor subunit 1